MPAANKAPSDVRTTRLSTTLIFFIKPPSHLKQTATLYIEKRDQIASLGRKILRPGGLWDRR